VLSNIIGTDLTKTPGLNKTLMGDGIASAIGTVVCGLPNTSYGESIATTGFSKVASVKVVTLAAILLGILSFLGPLQAVIQSIPSCVFGGCAMILYGYIACSGLKTIIREKTDLENNKNLIVVSVVLTTGIGGLALSFGTINVAGVALSMILGVVLNLILKDK
jgi:uracil permease